MDSSTFANCFEECDKADKEAVLAVINGRLLYALTGNEIGQFLAENSEVQYSQKQIIELEGTFYKYSTVGLKTPGAIIRCQGANLPQMNLSESQEELVTAIIKLGAENCQYMGPKDVSEWPFSRCDCKYGGPTPNSESTGCPELRSLLKLVASMNKRRWEETVANVQNFNRPGRPKS